jgi:transcription elongation factor GreA
MNRYPLTPEGHRRLAAELRHQKEVVRLSIVRDIEEARAHGDISENSEFEDAKERQALCEARISFLERIVAAAEVIDVTRLPQNGRVVFGTTVILEDPTSGEHRTFRLVGEEESDVDRGHISFTSPLGKALIGKEEGEEVTVPTPVGPKVWEIVEVQYVGPAHPAAADAPAASTDNA